jgi:hypothetical protein
MYLGILVKCPLFSSDFNKTRQRFEKYSNIKFRENPSSSSGVVHANRRTDMTKLTVVFAVLRRYLGMVLQGIGRGAGMDWTGLGLGQVGGTCRRGDGPSESLKC